MKWFSLLTVAAFVAGGLTAHADQWARIPASPDRPSSGPGFVLPAETGVDSDFPGYPPGFTSYRGLGFMGSCCQPCSPCAERAWEGYCEGLECGEPAPSPGFFAKLHGWMCPSAWARPPAWAWGPKGCDSCAEVIQKPSPKAHVCHEPLSVKLQRLRAQCAGMFGGRCSKSACEPWVEGGEMFAPESAAPMPESAEPIPPPTAPEAPPQATGETRPRRLNPPTSDRSAWQLFPWQLPGSHSGL
jgi:hypothetical protein